MSDKIVGNFVALSESYAILSRQHWLLKDQQRKRPPTEKPDENEGEFLAKILGSIWLATYDHNEEKWSNGPCWFKDDQVEWWVPVKHLLESDI